MKFWSEVDGCYIEADAVIFTGPRATHTLVDGTGWQQRYPPVVGTRQTGEYPTQGELRGKGTADVPFGADVFPRSRPHRGGAGRGHKGVLFIGGYCGCGEPISQSQWRRKYRRCVACRQASPGPKRQTAA